VCTARTGSTELLVGTGVKVAGDQLTLAEVDPDGVLTGVHLEHDLGEIVCIDWETTYLRDLAELGSL
jgi:hypothetical protein